MKKLLLYLMIFLPLVGLSLEPATITMTNFRGEVVSAASDAIFYRGDVVRFTNCVMYSSTGTSTTQDLSGLTVTVTHGDTLDTSTVSTGEIETAASGIWGVTTTLATNEADKTYSTYIQVRITDGTNSYTYPRKTLKVQDKL